MTGRVLAGRYALAEPLGKGGMGEVWAGRDTALGGRRVAVKLLHADRLASLAGTTDPEPLRRRFLRESRAAARIDHPGLVAVHDAGRDGAELYLVMQLVDGSDLGDHRAEHDPYPWPWAAAVLAQLASTLVAVHAAGVVHRDLKPGNVVVRPDGRVLVLDLGVAAVRGDSEDNIRLTRTGVLLGTPGYMAPEQALGGAPVGPGADLYALGVLGYELLAGRMPHTAPDPTGLLYKKLHEEPVPLQALRPDAPEPLTRLVHRLLARTPEERPADGHMVYGTLAPLLPRPDAAGAPGPPADPTRPFRHPMAPWPAPPPAEPDVAALLDQAVALLADGRAPEAAGLLGRALPAAAARFGDASGVARRLRTQYAATLLEAGQYAQALPEIRRLLRELAAERDPRDPLLTQLRGDEQLCLRRLGPDGG